MIPKRSPEATDRDGFRFTALAYSIEVVGPGGRRTEWLSLGTDHAGRVARKQAVTWILGDAPFAVGSSKGADLED